MLPISLLNAAQGQEITVECKSGRKYTGKMQACDLFMNVTLNNAKCTPNPDGEITTVPELYIRGYAVKYVKIPDSLLEDIMEERHQKRQELFGPQGSRRNERR